MPDLSGCRRERPPSLPKTAYFEIAPNWICEILSPSTASKDREVKMPLYARHGVSYAWILDPRAHSLETFELRDGTWFLIEAFANDDRVAVEPFTELAINLAEFWI